MNNVSLSGNICKDIELRTTQNGKQVVNFSLAINEGKDKTEFINCIAWEKTAELINQYVKKGDRLSCVGRLQTRSWEKDGQKRYATEVVVHQFDFPPKSSQAEKQEAFQGMPGDRPVEELEEEIPF